MSDFNKTSELLVDLSAAQEETIAGGLSIGSVGGGIDLKNIVGTGFSQQQLASVSSVKSGKDGSEVTRVIGASNTHTFANEFFSINL
ncbi:MAG: CTB family bacteriocin [Desmonostoc vinosum HA7617-LM4]|jgi:hypothetical protein|nr:CTB family bacteriocin [Desmonostoc vinosum HA7617-LM4]